MSEEKFGDVTCKNCKKIMPANEMTKVGKRFACSPECLAELGVMKCVKCSAMFEGYADSTDIMPLCGDCESWGNEKPTVEDFEGSIPSFLLDEKIIKKRKKSGAIVWINRKKWPKEVAWVYQSERYPSSIKVFLMMLTVVLIPKALGLAMRRGKQESGFHMAFYWAEQAMDKILTKGDRHDAALWIMNLDKLWKAVERKEEGFADLVEASAEFKKWY